jgi:type IV secretion system protein VirD4
MVSRQETARPLLTPGEVMQLPSTDELLLVSGHHPIRARKARYYEDRRLSERVLPPPVLGRIVRKASGITADDWRALPYLIPADAHERQDGQLLGADPANAGIRREPELPKHEEVLPSKQPADREFDVLEEGADIDVAKARTLRRSVRILARQAAMDPADGIGL